MAFASSVPRVGTAGDLKMIAGSWTGSLGDASGSYVLAAGTLYLARFNTNDTTSPHQEVPITWSGPTSGLITISVHNREAVTAGTYLIIYA